jgi:hypothetical protein
MGCYHPSELPIEKCKNCGRAFIRAKSWERYCRLPACQRKYEVEANADERKLNGRGRRALETASTWKKREKRLKNADSSL